MQARIEVPVALEPRHASWFSPGMEEWLAERRVARAAADPVPAAGAGVSGGWAGLVYYRLHGAPRRYHSSYDRTALAELRRQLDARRERGAETWCIFDNTASGAAFGNALALASPSDHPKN